MRNAYKILVRKSTNIKKCLNTEYRSYSVNINRRAGDYGGEWEKQKQYWYKSGQQLVPLEE
jgi:hypothetical protein